MKIKDASKLSLPEEIRKEIDEALRKCYTCSKCTSGCPVASEMDYPPSTIIKWLALGQYDKVLKSKAIWVCSSCQNCYSRCPFEVNIPHIIDLLKEHAYQNKISSKERAIQVFHKAFLSSIKRYGRIHEASFIGEWKIFSGKLFNDMSLGLKMFRKGKLAIFPEKIKQQSEIKKLFKWKKRTKK